MLLACFAWQLLPEFRAEAQHYYCHLRQQGAGSTQGVPYGFVWQHELEDV
jgi:hypothetical protein